MSKLDLKVIVAVVIGIVCAAAGSYFFDTAIGVWVGVGYLVYIIKD